MRYDYGIADRAFLEWEMAALKVYAGPNRIEEAERLYTMMLAFSDAELTAALAFKKQQAATVGKSMKHYTVPHLEAHLHVLGDLPKELQIALLDFKYYLDLYNAEVDSSNGYFTFTFTLDGDNQHVASGNLRECYRNIGDMALRLVTKADRAISLIDPKWSPPVSPKGTARFNQGPLAAPDAAPAPEVAG